MRKLIYAAIVIIIQHSTFSIQHSFAQSPNDNIGAGNALDFNGTSNYIGVGAANNVANSSGSTFSASMWVNFDNVNTVQHLMNRYQGSPPSGVFGWYIDMLANGQLELHFNNSQIGDAATTYAGIVTNRWYHVAVTYNGTGSLYVDGNLVGTCGNPGGATTGRPLNIGGDDRGFGFVDGQMDEVRIWNRVLTQAEIRDDMCQTITGNEANLIGYWNMNEGAGGTVVDSSPNGNNGTLN